MELCRDGQGLFELAMKHIYGDGVPEDNELAVKLWTEECFWEWNGTQAHNMIAPIASEIPWHETAAFCIECNATGI